MVSIAKMTREDRNLTQDDDHVWEEMVQVLELETDIANVSSQPQQEKESRDMQCDKVKNYKHVSSK